jgi:hypothetical protein
VKIKVNPHENHMELKWFMIKKQNESENSLLKGKGLIILNYLLNQIINDFPEFINTNPIIELDATPIDTFEEECTTHDSHWVYAPFSYTIKPPIDTFEEECTTHDWVRFLETPIAQRVLTSGDQITQEDMNYLYNEVRQRFHGKYFRHHVRYDLENQNQRLLHKRARHLFSLLCFVYKTTRLVQYYQSLSFKVVDARNPINVNMKTTLRSLMSRINQNVVVV